MCASAALSPQLTYEPDFETAQWTEIDDDAETAGTSESLPNAAKNIGHWLVAAIRSLFPLVELPAGWDGYGSNRISPDVMRRASILLFEIAGDLPPPPTIGPVPGGGVQIEWRVGPRDLEIEIRPDLSVEFLRDDAGDMDEGVLGDSPGTSVQDLMQWLLGK